jgi:hypothetical protein
VQPERGARASPLRNRSGWMSRLRDQGWAVTKAAAASGAFFFLRRVTRGRGATPNPLSFSLVFRDLLPGGAYSRLNLLRL